MNDLLEEMKENVIELEKMINELEKRSKKYPSGLLRCTTGNNGKKYNYYIREEGQKRVEERYVHKDELTIVKQISERDYERSLLDHLKKEYKLTKKYVNSFGKDKIDNLYYKMPKGRQVLFDPLIFTNEQAILKWEQKEYLGKEVDADHSFRTNRGELVRSKSEKIIADRLDYLGIPYRYEYPLKLDGYSRCIYVDFVVLNKRLLKEYYWEHLGMMDFDEYSTNAMKRLDLYEKNGYLVGKNLIITHETSISPLSMDSVDGYIKEFLL